MNKLFAFLLCVVFAVFVFSYTLNLGVYDDNGKVREFYELEDGTVVNSFTYYYSTVMDYVLSPFEALKRIYDKIFVPEARPEWLNNWIAFTDELMNKFKELFV